MIFKNIHTLFILFLITWVLIPSVFSETYAQKAKPVYEIAVRMVKKDKKADFVHQRANFTKLLKKQAGIGLIREFQSFDAWPTPDKQTVFIGITKYASLETVGRVSKRVMPRLMQFTQTICLKAYIFAMLVEGKKFKLKKLAAKKGQVLEIAIRRVKKGQHKTFQKARRAYVNYINKQKGVLGSWEFAVVGGRDRERLTVGMSVYKNKATLMKIRSQMESNPLVAQYFSTFDPVAIQYASQVTEE